ncbi:MaoC family dehydratase [Streptomyces sp. NPDC099050]|uniref:MaoC family dehydratase n=1 Tax=Streptomyces sp. NPDC099050 TaxID=3366100 RepID=UPI00380201C8
MGAKIRYADVEPGSELPGRTFTIERETLVRYAGASGDFNPIHWNDRFAAEVGLPGVIAHGMLTMAGAVRIVTDWTGDPGSLLSYTVRFTKPVPVPDDATGAVLDVRATAAQKLDDAARTVRVDITATNRDQKVLGMARAVVRLA